MSFIRFVALGLALACLAGTSGVLLAWATATWVSDRFEWSQPLSFVPRELLVWPAGVMFLMYAGLLWVYGLLRPRAEGVPWRSERRQRARGLRVLGHARGVAGLLVLGACLHMLVLEWRVPMNLERQAPPEGERFRVIHWNIGWSHPDEVLASLESRRPDLAIVVNPLTRTDLSWDFAGLGARLGGEGRVIRDWPINVISRWPVARWGVTRLGFTSRVSVESGVGDGQAEPPIDPGHATFVELEVGRPLSRTVVVWIIDLPSDPDLHRPAVMRQARQRIAAWLGPGGAGFPEPDIMIGDLNTPRGSWSLRELRTRPAFAMGDAHAQGGLGPSSTWPDRRPLLHIDQCFIAPGLRAARYAVEDGGDTRHRMQVVDVVATTRPAP